MKKKRKKKKKKLKKLIEDFKWCKEYSFFACLILVPIGLITIILLFVVLGIMNGYVATQQDLVVINNHQIMLSKMSPNDRREINELYFDKGMLDKTNNPCDNFYLYACGNPPQFKKNSFEQMKYLLAVANQSIFENNEFYKSCIGGGWFVHQEKKIQNIDKYLSIKVCNSHSVNKILRYINTIENLNGLAMRIGYLLECNFDFQFGKLFVESPLTLELNTRGPILYFYNSRTIRKEKEMFWIWELINRYFPSVELSRSKVDEIQTMLNEFITTSNTKNDGVCFENYEKFLETVFYVQFDWMVNNFVQLGPDKEIPICVSSVYFFKQLFAYMAFYYVENMDDAKNSLIEYLKYSILRSVVIQLHHQQRQEEGGEEEQKKKEFCMKETIEFFPKMYCNLVKEGIYNYEEVILPSVKEFSDYLLSFFIDQIENNWENYGLKCMNDKVINSLKMLQIDISGCSSEKKKIEVGSSFLDNVFRAKKQIDPFSNGIYKVLSAKHPYYMEGRHKIIIPLTSIIEPAYSMLYKNETRFGTLGFALDHEMFHSLIYLLKKNQMSHCLVSKQFSKQRSNSNLNEEQLCDILAMELISNCLEKKRFEEFEVLFPTVGQYLCHKVEQKQVWQKNKMSSRGHSNSDYRINYLINNLIGLSKEQFKKQYSCNSKKT